MSFEIAYVDDGRGLHFSGAGELTAPGVIELKQRLLAEPERLRRVVHALVLLDGVTRFDPASGEIRAIADVDETIAALVPDLCVAIVAPTDFLFGISRMWEAFAAATNWRIQVFRSRAEAETWLRERTSSPI